MKDSPAKFYKPIQRVDIFYRLKTKYRRKIFLLAKKHNDWKKVKKQVLEAKTILVI